MPKTALTLQASIGELFHPQERFQRKAHRLWSPKSFISSTTMKALVVCVGDSLATSSSTGRNNQRRTVNRSTFSVAQFRSRSLESLECVDFGNP